MLSCTKNFGQRRSVLKGKTQKGISPGEDTFGKLSFPPWENKNEKRGIQNICSKNYKKKYCPLEETGPGNIVPLFFYENWTRTQIHVVCNSFSLLKVMRPICIQDCIFAVICFLNFNVGVRDRYRTERNLWTKFLSPVSTEAASSCSIEIPS